MAGVRLRSLSGTQWQGMALNSKIRFAIKHLQSALSFVAIKGDSPLAISKNKVGVLRHIIPSSIPNARKILK